MAHGWRLVKAVKQKGKIMAREDIEKNLSLINKLIKECEDIAVKDGINFYFSGPDYSMGGYFYPRSMLSERELKYLDSDERGMWKPSNIGC